MQNISRTAQKVLDFLSEIARENEICTFSDEQIAEMMNMPTKWVSDALKSLQKRGYIRISEYPQIVYGKNGEVVGYRKKRYICRKRHRGGVK